MFKTILDFIINSVLANPNDFDLGFEIRALKETLEDLCQKDFNPVLDQILYLINKHPNDGELGSNIRIVSPILVLVLYAEEDSCGDCDA